MKVTLGDRVQDELLTDEGVNEIECESLTVRVTVCTFELEIDIEDC